MKNYLLLLLISHFSICVLSQSSVSFKNSSELTSLKLKAWKYFDKLPIKVTHTTSFSTDEASYIDVDLSPDRSTLLFSFLGDIYQMPAKGGAAKQLTRGLALKRCPVWSPDGKLIAYESDAAGITRLHVISTSGSFHKVFGDFIIRDHQLNPVWFPDSKHITFENYVYHLAGIETVLPKQIKSVLGFSGDKKFIYYMREITEDSFAIVKSNRVTGEQNELMVINYGFLDFNKPKISSDGQWLTYIKEHTSGSFDSLFVINLTNGQQRLLAEIKSMFYSRLSSATQQHYSISEDSKYLFIGYEGKIHRIEIETGENKIIPFTANVKVDLGALNSSKFNLSLDSFNVRYARSGNRSPHGKQLVFSALNKVYIMDLPNGKPHILVDQPFNQFEPAYSPDGKWICYVSWSDSAGGQVWRVLPSGGNPEQITTIAGFYQHPSWSSDGKQIVVAKGENSLGTRDNPGSGQIEIVTIKDRSVQVVAYDVPLFNNPIFSAGNKQIFYTSNQTDKDHNLWPALVSKNVSANGVREFAMAWSFNEFLSPIRQAVLSPDHRYLAFSYNDDIYLVALANITTSQMILDQKSPFVIIRFARGCIDPIWEKNGKLLGWMNGNKYCVVDPERIIEAAEQLKVNQTLEGLPQTKIIDVNISPDETIAIHLKAPRLYGKGIIAFKNARVITMHGTKVNEKGTLVIKNGRIVSVGSDNKISIPKEAVVIDLKGKTIMPGLIDMHSHMYNAVTPDVFLQQSWQRLLHLSYGVTTMRDPSGSFDTFGYSELVQTGQAIGPRLFTVGLRVGQPCFLSSVTDAVSIVDGRAKMGAVCIKQYGQPTRLQRQLLLLASVRAKVNMTNEGAKIPIYTIGMIKDGSAGIEHNPVWGNIYKDVVTIMSKSGTFLCPTLQVCYGKEEGKLYFRKLYGQDFLNKSIRFIPDDYRRQLLHDINKNERDSGFLDQSRIDARIKHAGGKIVMGSHGEDQGVGAHWEIWALQMGGLTNHEALETATITAAEGLGMQKDLGSIEVGKIADIIILDKNPLEDIHNTNTIKFVMKSGVLYDSETLDEIWPNKVKGPTVWR